MLNLFNWKTKKATQIDDMKKETETIFSDLASKQADLYASIERAMKRELKEQKS